MGIEARDSCDYDMSINFQPAADFMHRALSRGGKTGKRVVPVLLQTIRLMSVEVTCFSGFFRQSSGALSCGSQLLSHLGSGLLDAETEPTSCGGHLCCEK